MARETWHYQAYLLRLWWTGEAASPVCHASLADPHTGARLGFGNLEELMAFLALVVAVEVPKDEVPRITPDDEPDRATRKEE